MKTLTVLLFFFVFVAIFTENGMAQSSHSVVSPDGRIEIRIRTGGQIRYDILLKGRAILENCALALDVEHKKLGVGSRTALINTARGLTKSYGERLRGCSPRNMNPEKAQGLSPELQAALEPLLAAIESLSERIREYNQQIEKIARESYPQVAQLDVFGSVPLGRHLQL